MKLKLLLLTMICCIVTSTPVMATPDISLTAITDASINPTSEVLEWRYKIENGKLYKRLYNNTTESWVGDWIYVGEAN